MSRHIHSAATFQMDSQKKGHTYKKEIYTLPHLRPNKWVNPSTGSATWRGGGCEPDTPGAFVRCLCSTSNPPLHIIEIFCYVLCCTYAYAKVCVCVCVCVSGQICLCMRQVF